MSTVSSIIDAMVKLLKTETRNVYLCEYCNTKWEDKHFPPLMCPHCHALNSVFINWDRVREYEMGHDVGHIILLKREEIKNEER